MLPLYLPTLIFGAATVSAAGVADPGRPLLLTCGLTLFAVAVAPFAAARALRLSLQ